MKVLNSAGVYTFGIGINLPKNTQCAIQTMVDYKDTGILLLEGGQDVNPAKYGEQNRCSHYYGDSGRDQHEVVLFREAVKLGIPVLGICRGHQLVNVVLGGSLYQDLRTDRGVGHAGEHWIDVTDELKEITNAESGECVNSYHHQGIRDLALGGRVIGVAKDKLIEAVIYEKLKCITVQYHPEFVGDFRYLEYIQEVWR